MTGLYRRKDSGIWWMNFTVKGKHYRRSTDTRDKKLAEAILGKVRAQIIESKWFEVDEARQHTFEELMNRYLKEHSAVNKTKESYGNDKNYVNHLSTSFAGLSLDKITPNKIAQYKSIRTAKGAKPQTVKHEMICLNHAFNLAIKEWEWATVNPVQRVKMPKVQNQIDRCLSYEEQDKLIEAAITQQII